MSNLKLFKVQGCSVSMPYKTKVIQYIDKLDSIARNTKSVNTILNKNDILFGFNTDSYGIKKSIQEIKLNRNESVLVIGSGAMSINSIHILKSMKIKNISISSRNNLIAKKLAIKHNIKFIKWENRNKFSTDLLINCSPIGMLHIKTQMPLSSKSILKIKKVIDVVNKPHETKLIKFCKENKIKYISGKFLNSNQLIKQIEIYTNIKVSLKKINELYKIQ